jgi:hypothetical protein
MVIRAVLALALFTLPSIALADIAEPPDSGRRDAGTSSGDGGCAVSQRGSDLVPLAFAALGLSLIVRQRSRP